jgi:hypothetical protein
MFHGMSEIGIDPDTDTHSLVTPPQLTDKCYPWHQASALANRADGAPKVAAIALTNKIARMPWAMMVKGERCKEPVALAYVSAETLSAKPIREACAGYSRKRPLKKSKGS